jgi:hypothetical protein
VSKVQALGLPVTHVEGTEQDRIDKFLSETTLFLGPASEIMRSYSMQPRTEEEERLLSGPIEAYELDRVRKRIVAGLDEAFEMMEQTGAAPGPSGAISRAPSTRRPATWRTSVPAACWRSRRSCTTRA